MPRMKTQIVVVGNIGVKDSVINKMKASTLGHIAEQWDVRYRAGKFTAAGARKYNYAKRFTKNIRSGTVNRSKKTGRPLAPDARPLVWTRQSLALSKTHKVYSTRNNSRVTYPIRIFNRPGGNPKINKRKEFTTVLPSEERRLGRDGEIHIRKMFKRGKKNVIVITN